MVSMNAAICSRITQHHRLQSDDILKQCFLAEGGRGANCFMHARLMQAQTQLLCLLYMFIVGLLSEADKCPEIQSGPLTNFNAVLKEWHCVQRACSGTTGPWPQGFWQA